MKWKLPIHKFLYSHRTEIQEPKTLVILENKYKIISLATISEGKSLGNLINLDSTNKDSVILCLPIYNFEQQYFLKKELLSKLKYK